MNVLWVDSLLLCPPCMCSKGAQVRRKRSACALSGPAFRLVLSGPYPPPQGGGAAGLGRAKGPVRVVPAEGRPKAGHTKMGVWKESGRDLEGLEAIWEVFESNY